ncbi:Rieske (2Fe-2S) protein [Streptomyces sp. NPDC087512]|uniref:Rieske (2Fe-2S) protein n=1 Tax=unclassified Streptomyces TaxID=2593676 RepID=UPI00341F8680
MVSSPARRTVLLTTGAVALVAGCGGGGGTTGSSSGAAPGRELTRTEDVPVGGGRVLAEEGIVVTQPEPGEFKAFSAVCTHQGCTVTDVSGGTINCVCHDSRFRIADGAVERGPATGPLPERPITVEGNSVRPA